MFPKYFSRDHPECVCACDVLLLPISDSADGDGVPKQPPAGGRSLAKMISSVDLRCIVISSSIVNGSDVVAFNRIGYCIHSWYTGNTAHVDLYDILLLIYVY